MACRIAYYEIYFNNVPKSIDGGYCCFKVKMTKFTQREFTSSGTWNDYFVRAGRRAYTNIRAWGIFLGMKPNVYNDGSISKYTYNLDWQHYETFKSICLAQLNMK